MNKIFLVFFTLAAVNSAFTDNICIVPDLKAQGNQTAIAVSDDGNYIFSADISGNLSVWKSRDRILVKSFPLSRLTIDRIVCNPVRDEIAVIETNYLNLTSLTAWNWKTGEKIFSNKLESVPLEIQYSPKGTYIVYSTDEWSSLKFLNSTNGFLRPVMDKETGIIPAFFITDTEKTIVTYNMIGSLQYWSLPDGKLKAEFPTQSNLSAFAFHEEAKYIACSDGLNLMVMNPANGKIVKKAEAENISKIVIADSRIICSSDDKILSWNYNISQNSLASDYVPGSDYTDNIYDFIFDNSTVFAATSSGLFSTQIKSSSQLPFGSLERMDFISMALNNDSLVLINESKTLIVKHPLFSGQFFDHQSAEIKTYQTPVSGSPQVMYYREGEFCVYNTEGNRGYLAFLSPESGYENFISNFDSPFSSIKQFGENLLLLLKNGKVKIYNGESGIVTDSYSSSGVNDAVLTSDGKLVTGRISTPQLNYSLLEINLKTQETLPIENQLNDIRKLFIDENSNTIYSMGYAEINNSLFTLIKSHANGGTGREVILQKNFGSYDNTFFYFDKLSGKLFSSLSDSTISCINNPVFQKYLQTAGNPETASAGENILISLNTNNSLSIWDKRTAEYLGTVYIFRDLSWTFISGDGNYYAAEDLSDKDFSAYRANSAIPVFLSQSYRINLNTQ